MFHVAYRVVNIGNSNKVRLMDYIQAIEDKLGIKIIIRFKRLDN
jgi:hypothetical protein